MNKCLMCGREIKMKLTLKWLLSMQPLRDPVICQNCMESFSKIELKSICPGCGRRQKERRLCQDCQRWLKMGEKNLLKNRAMFVYDAVMKEYMQRYKFSGDYQWRLIFQEQFTNFIKQNSQQNYLYVAIPVDQHTFNTRGFNQVEGLLQNIELSPLLEFQTKQGHVKQSTKTRKARMETTQPFKYKGARKLDGENIILLDDIYTTGRTLYHAKHILEAQGAGSIYSLTLAR